MSEQTTPHHDQGHHNRRPDDFSIPPDVMADPISGRTSLNPHDEMDDDAPDADYDEAVERGHHSVQRVFGKPSQAEGAVGDSNEG